VEWIASDRVRVNVMDKAQRFMTEEISVILREHVKET
jgi:predicted SAM-dependent methyltransferase